MKWKISLATLAVAIAAFYFISLAFTLPLGSPRWDMLASANSSNQYRVSYLTYDERGLSVAPCTLNSGCSDELIVDELSRSRQAASCVYAEILSFIKRQYADRVEISDANLPDPSVCKQTMGNNSANALLEKNNYLTVVVFAHGWQNTAASNNKNVQSFNQLLAKLSDRQKNNSVYGIYLGWPGADYKGPLALARFWDRKRTADEVSRVDMSRDILRFYHLWNLEKQLAAEAHKTSVELLRPHQSKLRLIVAGHSFGARIIYNVAYPHLINATLNNAITRDDDGNVTITLACKGTLDNCGDPNNLTQTNSQAPLTTARFKLEITGDNTAELVINRSTNEDITELGESAKEAIERGLFASTYPALQEMQKLQISYAGQTRVVSELTEFDPETILIEDVSQARSLLGFGDLLVLLNPAFEASRYLALYEAQQNHTFPSTQKPVLLALSSTSDLATKWAFPFGKGMESGFGFWLDARKTLAGQTVGNYDTFVEHTFSVNAEQQANGCHNKSFDFNNGINNQPFIVASTNSKLMKNHSDVFNGCVRKLLEEFVVKAVLPVPRMDQ